MRHLRGHVATILSVLFVVLGIAWAARVQVTQNDDRRERVDQVNTLACVLRSDAIALIAAVNARSDHPFPGDDGIVASKRAVILAVNRLTPDCLSPKGSP